MSRARVIPRQTTREGENLREADRARSRVDRAAALQGGEFCVLTNSQVDVNGSTTVAEFTDWSEAVDNTAPDVFRFGTNGVTVREAGVYVVSSSWRMDGSAAGQVVVFRWFVSGTADLIGAANSDRCTSTSAGQDDIMAALVARPFSLQSGDRVNVGYNRNGATGTVLAVANQCMLAIWRM